MMSELKRKKKVIIIYELKVYDTWIGSIRLVCLLLSVCGCLVSGLDAFQMVDLDSNNQDRRRDEGTDNSDDSVTIVCITEEHPSGDIQHVE